MPKGNGVKYVHVKVIMPFLSLTWNKEYSGAVGTRYENNFGSKDIYININGETND
jgi:hypothetical protein